jgi:hypothetical protein
MRHIWLVIFGISAAYGQAAAPETVQFEVASVRRPASDSELKWRGGRLDKASRTSRQRSQNLNVADDISPVSNSKQIIN